MRSAALTRVNGSRIQLVLCANCLLELTYGFFNKNFQGIKLFICHFSLITLAPNTIVRLQPQNVGLLSILELKLKCFFCTCSIELLFIFVFITWHLRILQCTALFLSLVPWIQLKPLMNKFCFHLFVYCFIFSLKKWAYLKYERLLLYSNDRLVGFSSPS